MSSPSALNCFADADMMSYRTILAEGGRAALPLHAGATQTFGGSLFGETENNAAT